MLSPQATKKKWFQVIRFPASPTTGMHGTELRVQERRTFRLSAPPKPFSPAPGSMLPDFAAAFYLLSSTEPEARNGLSLASNGCRLLATSIPGSTFLACYFAPCLKRFPARSALLLHHLAGSPRSMATSMRLARCSSASRLDWPLPLPPLPFGTLTSLRIKVFSRLRCPSTRLPSTPDFLSLPDAGSISRVGLGSPFLVRFVSGD